MAANATPAPTTTTNGWPPSGSKSKHRARVCSDSSTPARCSPGTHTVDAAFTAQSPRMSLADRLQDRPLLHALVQTGKRDVPWPVALRNSAAIVLPLALGAASGHFAAGLGISAGALNTMFAD